MTASHVPIDGTYARRRACALASAILIGLTLVGCGTTYNDYEIDPGTVYDGDPLVEPLPFAIGVYYGPEFHVQEANIKRSGPSWVDRYHLRLGPSSIWKRNSLTFTMWNSYRSIRLESPNSTLLSKWHFSPWG
jgi:hypothetical protein